MCNVSFIQRDVGVRLQEDDIETSLGPIHVSVQGDRSRPAILTYHDIGLTSEFLTKCAHGELILFRNQYSSGVHYKRLTTAVIMSVLVVTVVVLIKKCIYILKA